MMWMWFAFLSMFINLWLVWKLVEADAQIDSLYDKALANSKLVIDLLDACEEKEALQKAIDEYEYQDGRL
tara:strand:- start:350 stop:559 length:210 start_codon:yes stop_codon:yes gene_type:complete